MVMAAPATDIYRTTAHTAAAFVTCCIAFPQLIPDSGRLLFLHGCQMNVKIAAFRARMVCFPVVADIHKLCVLQRYIFSTQIPCIADPGTHPDNSRQSAFAKTEKMDTRYKAFAFDKGDICRFGGCR